MSEMAPLMPYTSDILATTGLNVLVRMPDPACNSIKPMMVLMVPLIITLTLLRSRMYPRHVTIPSNSGALVIT
ncbi:Uncharacterised protein [Enterobacter cloacae]|nr:Uncharacterised protein [Enterobacter cloacae]